MFCLFPYFMTINVDLEFNCSSHEVYKKTENFIMYEILSQNKNRAINFLSQMVYYKSKYKVI